VIKSIRMLSDQFSHFV